MPARKNKPHFTREALGAAKKKKAKQQAPSPEDLNSLEVQKQLKSQVTGWLMCPDPECGWQEEITVVHPSDLPKITLVCPGCGGPVRVLDCL
jgi:hypothetical protein